MQIGIDFQGQEKILSLRELWVLVDTFGSTIILMQQKLMIIRKNGKYSGTQLLETILLNDFKGAENLYLAELQFAFVAFMLADRAITSSISSMEDISKPFSLLHRSFY
ncbi:hypothetical protein IHE45_14G044400 [Dioscorea alata]|uniref:Uncharacterized protein n=2 Tax=Dioscorea alata TaxID=55571 RepID=A0ACB7URF0_DIOAL|nr:hypothetical protein IHE45_14G044400 [Dioscorea alata]KAH7663300.1 hypothetical protein IHE45_14G044400 [Dioscorea alata]